MNLSVRSHVFLDTWKSSLVTPLSKEGSPEEPGNYRTISLLSLISKWLRRWNMIRYMNISEIPGSFAIGNPDSGRGTPQAAVY